MVQAAFIMNNDVKTSDINTAMSRIYIQSNITNDTKPRCMCLCDTQYYNGQNTNINICCTQQSAHECQVSKCAFFIWQLPANLGTCDEGCIDYTNINVLTTYYSQDFMYMCDNLSYDKPGGLCIGNYTKNISPSNLAACLSHDCQSLYSRQEFSFGYNDSFNFYNYVSKLEQFSYQHDVMNKSNIFTLTLVNETSFLIQY